MTTIVLTIAPISWNYYDIRYFNEWYNVAWTHGILAVYKYASKVAYPPLPIILYITTYKLAEWIAGDYIPLIRLIIKIPLIISMLLITHIIYRLKGFKAVTLWALCPAGYGIILVYQFDLIAALTLILSYYFILKDRHWLAGLSFAVAILTKHILVMLAPVYMIYYLRKKMYRQLQQFMLTLLTTCVTVITPFLLYSPEQFIYKLLFFHANRLPQGLSIYAIPLYLVNYRYTVLPDMISYIWFPILLVIYSIELAILYSLKKFDNKKLLYGITIVALTCVLLNKVGNPQYYLWFAPFIPLIAVNKGLRDKVLAIPYILAPVFSTVLFPIVYMYSAAMVHKPVFVPEDKDYENAMASIMNSTTNDPFNISTIIYSILETNGQYWYAIYNVSHLILAVISIVYSILLAIMLYRVLNIATPALGLRIIHIST